ncbi:conserved hypothetical protein [Gammaproteobacteria bacterium]
MAKIDVVIANGESLSGAVQLGGAELIGVVMPAAWTAANLTLQVSADGTTFNNLYDVDGNEVPITAAASRYINLLPINFVGFQWIKVRSGTSGTPVAQGAARTIGIVAEDL